MRYDRSPAGSASKEFELSSRTLFPSTIHVDFPAPAPVRHGRSPLCHTTLHNSGAEHYPLVSRPTAPPRAESVNLTSTRKPKRPREGATLSAGVKSKKAGIFP
jgi:hypothetical protein